LAGRQTALYFIFKLANTTNSYKLRNFQDKGEIKHEVFWFEA